MPCGYLLIWDIDVPRFDSSVKAQSEITKTARTQMLSPDASPTNVQDRSDNDTHTSFPLDHGPSIKVSHGTSAPLPVFIDAVPNTSRSLMACHYGVGP